MLSEVLQKIISYTPQAMVKGSMWWWILPLAPGIPERLVVGNERKFLTWFYEGATAVPNAIAPTTIDEYLRTFSGREGVLGAMGVYRAAFTSISQTEALTRKKVGVPVIALGGSANGLGAKVGEMVKLVAENVEAHTLSDSGHFLPEEQPDAVIKHILSMAVKTAKAA
jgi:pimeloyl-ACP methyl ester carboxylesterase